MPATPRRGKNALKAPKKRLRQPHLSFALSPPRREVREPSKEILEELNPTTRRA